MSDDTTKSDAAIRKQRSRETKKESREVRVNVEIETPMKALLTFLAKALDLTMSQVVRDLIAAYPEGVPALKHVLWDSYPVQVDLSLTEAERTYLLNGKNHKPTPLSMGGSLEHLLVACLSGEGGSRLVFTHPVSGRKWSTGVFLAENSMILPGFCKYKNRHDKILKHYTARGQEIDWNDFAQNSMIKFGFMDTIGPNTTQPGLPDQSTEVPPAWLKAPPRSALGSTGKIVRGVWEPSQSEIDRAMGEGVDRGIFR